MLKEDATKPLEVGKVRAQQNDQGSIMDMLRGRFDSSLIVSAGLGFEVSVRRKSMDMTGIKESNDDFTGSAMVCEEALKFVAVLDQEWSRCKTEFDDSSFVWMGKEKKAERGGGGSGGVMELQKEKKQEKLERQRSKRVQKERTRRSSKLVKIEAADTKQEVMNDGLNVLDRLDRVASSLTDACVHKMGSLSAVPEKDLKNVRIKSLTIVKLRLQALMIQSVFRCIGYARQ
jgi:hypothetical protein